MPNFGWRFSSTHQYFFLLILLNHHEGFLRLLCCCELVSDSFDHTETDLLYARVSEE